MMMSEFIERTGYEPTNFEYHHIEESYYEFDGNKDEFCKQWKKDLKDGHWAKELKLRMQMEGERADYEGHIKERDETIAFYRPYFDRAFKAEKELKEAQEKLERIQRVYKRVFGEE